MKPNSKYHLFSDEVIPFAVYSFTAIWAALVLCATGVALFWLTSIGDPTATALRKTVGVSVVVIVAIGVSFIVPAAMSLIGSAEANRLARAIRPVRVVRAVRALKTTGPKRPVRRTAPRKPPTSPPSRYASELDSG